jgi:predicted SnoaL-like aldol condensation-catalyzing enzyme
MHMTSIILLFIASLSIATDPFDWANSKRCSKTRGVQYDSYCPSREATEEHQRKIFARFVETLYEERNVAEAFSTYVDPDLIEHDPYDQNRDDVVAKLSHIIPGATFTVVHSTFESDTGFVHLRLGEDGAPPVALADIYRMDGTCIVEHWEVIQTRPDNYTNPIAMF